MSKRSFGSGARLAVLSLAALSFAALAVYFADRHVNETIAKQQAAAKRPAPATIPIVVAKFDLIAGEAVGPDNMAIRPIPVDLAPSSALRPEQFDAKAGMRLTRALRGGEPLLTEILQPAEPAGLSARVRQGIRALTIAVDDVNAVSGMLRPGDRIDLLYSARSPGLDGAPAVETSRVLVQDVAVLATGRQFRAAAEDSSNRAFTSITVELSPDDAQRLIVAQRTGRVTALLRNPDDRHAVSTKPVDANALLGVAPRPAPIVSRPAVRSGPEMIVGGGGGLAGSRQHGGAEAAVVSPSEPIPQGVSRLPNTSSAAAPPPDRRVSDATQPDRASQSPSVAAQLSLPQQPLLFR